MVADVGTSLLCPTLPFGSEPETLSAEVRHRVVLIGRRGTGPCSFTVARVGSPCSHLRYFAGHLLAFFFRSGAPAKEESLVLVFAEGRNASAETEGLLRRGLFRRVSSVCDVRMKRRNH